MCAAVAPVVRPDQFSVTVILFRAALSETVPVPVPSEALGGTSCVPDKVTVVVQVGPAVGVAVAVAVAVAVKVGPPPGIVTLPLVVEAAGSPSLNWNAGWKFMLGSV